MEIILDGKQQQQIRRLENSMIWKENEWKMNGTVG
jgi:hypothetical protein